MTFLLYNCKLTSIKMNSLIYLLYFSLFLMVGHSYKILVIAPMPGKSHAILNDAVVKLLLDAGHDVYHVTAFPKQDIDRLHNIDVSNNIQIIPGQNAHILQLNNRMLSNNAVVQFTHEVREISKKAMNSFVSMDGSHPPSDETDFIKLLGDVALATLDNENFQKILVDSKQHFDVVLAEWMYTELYSGVATLFGCPFVWISTIEPHWMVLTLIDQVTNPAYAPSAVSTHPPPFTFKQRVTELFQQIAMYLYKEVYYFKEDERQYERIFGPLMKKRGKELPSYNDVKYNASLMLGNSHVVSGQATSLPQSYKSLAGWHIDSNIKPLTEDLKKIIQNAKEGVIYFSLGSNVKSKALPDSLKKNLLKMFSELKQTVLWKFEEKLDGLPKNVHILSWAPQTAILAHPNTRLFITHGGLLSITETICYGVPTIGIPIFADQFINVHRAVKKGFGKLVPLSLEMADHLRPAIQEIINNPTYTEKAKELSTIFHDRPVPPGKELVFWTEHVVKTRGALHLRSPALTTPLYQKLYLDLLGLVVAVLLILRKILMIVLDAAFRKKAKSVDKKKN